MTALAFSEDDRRVAVANGVGVVVIWPSDNSVVKPWRIDMFRAVNALAFHPSGDLVSIATDSVISVITASPQAALVNEMLSSGSRPVRAVVFSGDGKYLISGGDDQLVRIWDMVGITDPNLGAPYPRGADRLLMALVGQAGAVRSLVLDSSGQGFLSGGEDGAILLRSLLPMPGISEEIRRLASNQSDIRSSVIGTKSLTDGGKPSDSPNTKIGGDQFGVYIAIDSLDKGLAERVDNVLSRYSLMHVFGRRADGGITYLNTMRIARDSAERILSEIRAAGIPARIER